MKSYAGKCLGKKRMKWKTCPRGRTNCTNCELYVKISTCDICGEKAKHAIFYRDTGEPALLYCRSHAISVKNHLHFGLANKYGSLGKKHKSSKFI